MKTKVAEHFFNFFENFLNESICWYYFVRYAYGQNKPLRWNVHITRECRVLLKRISRIIYLFIFQIIFQADPDIQPNPADFRFIERTLTVATQMPSSISFSSATKKNLNLSSNFSLKYFSKLFFPINYSVNNQKKYLEKWHIKYQQQYYQYQDNPRKF